jgi:hypothetical protein
VASQLQKNPPRIWHTFQSSNYSSRAPSSGSSRLTEDTVHKDRNSRGTRPIFFGTSSRAPSSRSSRSSTSTTDSVHSDQPAPEEHVPFLARLSERQQLFQGTELKIV